MTNNEITIMLDVPEAMMRKLEVIARKKGCTVENLVQSWMDDYVEHWKSPAEDGG